MIRLDNDVKAPGSVDPIPPSECACDFLRAWKEEQGTRSRYVFPSPISSDRPISTVKTACNTPLRRAGVPHLPLYKLRHVFCSRLSGVVPDAVVQRAMRHSSPETERRHQSGMADQERKAVEKANTRLYGRRRALHFSLTSVPGTKRKAKSRSATD